MNLEIETAGASYTELQARGLALDTLLRQAVAERARRYRSTFPGFVRNLTVRVFGVGGSRVGPDKGCLVCATLGPDETVVVSSDIGCDARRAVHGAFGKLERGTRASLDGRHRPAPPRQDRGALLATP